MTIQDALSMQSVLLNFHSTAGSGRRALTVQFEAILRQPFADTNAPPSPRTFQKPMTDAQKSELRKRVNLSNDAEMRAVFNKVMGKTDNNALAPPAWPEKAPKATLTFLFNSTRSSLFPGPKTKDVKEAFTQALDALQNGDHVSQEDFSVVEKTVIAKYPITRIVFIVMRESIVATTSGAAGLISALYNNEVAEDWLPLIDTWLDKETKQYSTLRTWLAEQKPPVSKVAAMQKIAELYFSN